MERWQHIVDYHDDMIGRQTAVKKTVEHPSAIYESTANPNALIFHAHGLLLPRQNVVRVVMRYEKITEVRSGTTVGHIVTAFAPSPATELSGGIGPLFYQRQKPQKSKGRRR